MTDWLNKFLESTLFLQIDLIFFSHFHNSFEEDFDKLFGLAAPSDEKTVPMEWHEEALLPICTEILSRGTRQSDEHFLKLHYHLREG